MKPSTPVKRFSATEWKLSLLLLPRRERRPIETDSQTIANPFLFLSVPRGCKGPVSRLLQLVPSRRITGRCHFYLKNRIQEARNLLFLPKILHSPNCFSHSWEENSRNGANSCVYQPTPLIRAHLWHVHMKYSPRYVAPEISPYFFQYNISSLLYKTRK